jgi:hypothetical protein
MPDDGRRNARKRLVQDVVTGQVGWTPDDGPSLVPAELPYVPLGRRGEWLFMLDPAGEFMPIRIADLSRQTVLMSVFAGAPGSLFRLYPKLEKDKAGNWKAMQGKYAATHAADHILRLSAGRGQFHPERQLRGRGAWIDHDPKREPGKQNRFVCNLGDALLIGDRREEKPGPLHGFAYPSGAPKLPIAGAKPPPSGIGFLDQGLSAWSWQFPRLAPRLLTGWLALAPISGALAPHQPVVSISGGDGAGRGLLIRLCGALLGDWAINAADATPTAIEDATGWDSLPVIIEAKPRPAPIALRTVRRRPMWALDALAAASQPRMMLCRSEAATVLQFPIVLDLALSAPLRAGSDWAGKLLEQAGAHRAWLAGRPGERWRALMTEAFPKWRALLAMQDGLTKRADLLAMLLAGASILRGEDPSEADFEAIEPELTAFMLAMRADKLEPWRRVFELLFGSVLEPFGVTVLVEVAAAAGFGQAEASDGGMVEQPGYLRTEAEAVAHAKHDPIALRGVQRIGPLGLKVLEAPPSGFRMLAIALTAPARTRLLERTSTGADLITEGVTVANTLLNGIDCAERSAKPIYFPGLGMARCILLPLNFVLDRLVGSDPAAAAEAWERKPEA